MSEYKDKAVDELIRALEALGYTDMAEGDAADEAYLTGALLAALETRTWDLGHAVLPVVVAGYMSVILAHADGDPEGAGRGWAVMLGDRLNRTALELRNTVDGEGQAFSNVAGPSMLVAASLLNIINRSPLDQRMVKESMAHADHNLTKAQENLEELRIFLKGQGFAV